MRRFKYAVSITPYGELTFFPFAWTPRGEGVLLPVPEDVKEKARAFEKEVDKLIERHKKTAIPLELQAELQALRALLDEATGLFFTMTQYELAEPVIRYVREFVDAKGKLSEHIEKLRERIQRKERFLQTRGRRIRTEEVRVWRRRGGG